MEWVGAEVCLITPGTIPILPSLIFDAAENSVFCLFSEYSPPLLYSRVNRFLHGRLLKGI